MPTEGHGNTTAVVRLALALPCNYVAPVEWKRANDLTGNKRQSVGNAIDLLQRKRLTNDKAEAVLRAALARRRWCKGE